MNRSVVVVLFLSLGVTLGLSLALVTPEPDAQQTIEWLDNPRSLASFSLETEAGEFDNGSFTGHWTIVLFGFLNCPDICPTSLSQLARLADHLAETSIDQDVAFVFVSVDPGRDSVAEVNRYVQHFDASFRGVTGNQEQLTQFASGLGIQFKVIPDADDYAVAHSITYSIIDPDGVFRGRFRPGFKLADLATSLTTKVMEAKSHTLAFAGSHLQIWTRQLPM